MVVLLLSRLLCSAGGLAQAQDRARQYTSPILRHAGEGHHAPVRELIFARDDGSLLLSGGQDKVIHAWSPGAGNRSPIRTLHPPLWRGSAGAIHAMALAPRGDAEGQRVLAIAGYGVEAGRGNVILYRFPGGDPAAQATGEIVGQLHSALRGAVGGPRGHSGVVQRLAFDPGGAFLASAGDDTDVLIWNVAQRQAITALPGHARPVRGLAYLPGGRRLATGDSRGVVRVWDITRPGVATLVGQSLPLAPSGPAASALAVSPDGQWLVAGADDGSLIRLDAATLRQAVHLPTLPTQADVRALAISHDGRRLLTSITTHRLVSLAELPRLDCTVELRSFPDGRVQATLAQVDGAVECCTFSGDDRFVAYAGDAWQTIRVRDLRDQRQPPIELRGPGATIRDVAFRRDGRAIGFSRRPWGGNNDNRPYEGFDLVAGRLTTIAAAELVHADSTRDGWTIRPLSPTELIAEHAGSPPVRIALDPDRDVRWWCYGLLAPRRAGARPLAAIGCESGVSIHSLDAGGRRTRLLAGHEGAVTCLAAAPDGRWLVTGSFDQTVRLWTLQGAESVATLGAAYRPAADGSIAVATVEPRSFAEEMGLRAGDILEVCGFGDNRVRPADFVARVDAIAPNIPISIQVRPRPDEPGRDAPQMVTTKREPPAASLFASAQPPSEWVLWMPQGYYDTSIAGDGKYLGWHLNAPPSDPPRPNSYYPIQQFQERLYRKDILKRLLETADINPALALAGPTAGDPMAATTAEQPPAVSLASLEQRGDRAALRIQVESAPGRALKETRVRNGVRLLHTIEHEPGTTRFEQILPVLLDGGKNRLNVTATDRGNRSQTRSVEIDSQGSPDHPPRAWIITIGADTFLAAGVEPILHAARDARALAAFFEDRVVAPGLGRRIARDQIKTSVLAANDARADPVLAVLDALRERCRQGRLGPDDLLVMAVETHFAIREGRAVLLAADTRDEPPGPMLAADLLATCLGEVAASGCKVLLLLDIVHNVPGDYESDTLKAWIRELRDRHGVITFLASRTLPSEPRLENGQPTYPGLRNRIFTRAVLDSIDPRWQTRDRVTVQGCVSLHGFQETVRAIIAERTRDSLDAACYIPDVIPAWFPLLDASIR
jgi:WD40 repeat protein